MTQILTREKFDELVAQAIELRIPGGNPERWAWNRAAILGLHPELSDIPEPPRSAAEKRQGDRDWHDDRRVTRNWLSRRA